MKTIQWNRRAVEQAREQGVGDPREVTCRGCGTHPALRQFGIFRCECGELEGLVTER
jgi:hypothetical protein